MLQSTLLLAVLVLSEVASPTAATSASTLENVVIDTTPIAGNTPRVLLVNETKDVWSRLKETQYTHRKQSVIDLDRGIVKFDCSGFVCEVVLKNALPDHYRRINSYLKKNRTSIPSAENGRMWMTRPLAGLFYDYLEKQQPDDWLVFRSPEDLMQGDIIVARYDDEWRIRRGKSTTGHIMIAWDVKQAESETSIQVRVFDSSQGAHTKRLDTRHQVDGRVTAIDNSGIGSGVMRFRLDRQGNANGYKWSLTSKRWYNQLGTEEATGNQHYDRLEGILFARPIDPVDTDTNLSDENLN
ncbi:hypothetical protein [Rhodopirellula bahusiensis]|uniref:Uncharacterized protein n=1 Tax=Rhodopirellula bahusiensis TaxID=2014065 RepID=A0A2G1W530_9BACT|nr:hypothetical protein [Rhodopirellula bahusiensis]PHQ34136.1 hypothetical protein CEE69_17455 [Rhodopirellula bahusiensis]